MPSLVTLAIMFEAFFYWGSYFQTGMIAQDVCSYSSVFIFKHWPYLGILKETADKIYALHRPFIVSFIREAV